MTPIAAGRNQAHGKVLVAGASGLVGRAVAERYSETPGWEVVGLSRRTTGAPAGVTVHGVDLGDPDECDAAITRHPDITHLVYAAVSELPGLSAGWHDQATIDRNAAMFRNVMSAACRHAPALEHVTLLQGSKAYGIHLPDREVAPSELPLREHSTRVEHPNFYFAQEAVLAELRHTGSWGVTIFRPTVVYGDAWGVNMNPLLPIAVLAALHAAAGQPLPRPWAADRGPTYVEAVDAALLAEAIVWAGRAPAARDRTFNITNGDVFVWEGIWPSIAAAFGLEVGAHQPLSFERDVATRGDEWARLVRQHDLVAPPDLSAFVGHNSFVYADRVVAGQGTRGQVPLNSTVALRQAGFAGCLDTDDMFRRQVARLQRSAVLPPVRLPEPQPA